MSRVKACHDPETEACEGCGQWMRACAKVECLLTGKWLQRQRLV